MKSVNFLSIFLILILHGIARCDDKQSAKDEIDDIKKLLSSGTTTQRPKTLNLMAEINDLRMNLVKSNTPFEFSDNLAKMLKTGNPEAPNLQSVLLPSLVNSDDISHSGRKSIESFMSLKIDKSPIDELDVDYRAIAMKLAANRHEDITNLYRENLKILSINEVTKFNVGKAVFEWKVLQEPNNVFMFGMMKDSIVVLKHDGVDKYEKLATLPIEITDGSRYFLEVTRFFDDTENRVKNIMIVAYKNTLFVYELGESNVQESFRRTFASKMESMLYLKQGNSQCLILVMSDDLTRFHAKFFDFNFNNGEFGIIQALNLPTRPKNITFVDLGNAMMIGFVMNDEVLIYQNQAQPGQKMKFELSMNIEAKNATTAKGFRIGGQSYLAIGGTQPKILRFVNGNFQPQTHFGQSFGLVEQFLPIPIRTYRDDLVLLVQHRLNFSTHSVAVIDALIWNGIEFETVHSVPCDVTIEPHPQGFGCTVDPERFEGFKGASFVNNRASKSFLLIVPKKNAQSGMFMVKYDIVEAEDPFMKEKEQLKKSIDAIELMLNYEDFVRKSVEEVLQAEFDPRNEFAFGNLKDIDEIQTESLEIGEGNIIEDGEIEFVGSKWTQDDFTNLEEQLDRIEKTLDEDENRLRKIDEKLNSVNRMNRQAQLQASDNMTDSPIHYIGPVPFNGQIDFESLKVALQEMKPNRQRRQINIDPIKESEVASIKAKNLQLETVNGVNFEDLIFVDDDGVLRVPDKTVKFSENLQVDTIELANNGKVNGIDLSSEVLTVENIPSSVTFENLVVQQVDAETLNDVPIDLKTLRTLDIPTENKNMSLESVEFLENLNLQRINGIDFKEFVSKIILKNRKSEINEILLNGNVTIDGDASKIFVDNLNGLKFPEEFVLTQGPGITTIEGKKIFSKVLATQAIDTDGSVDGVDTKLMITLDQPQEITSETTFESLEVSNKLEVNGTISGRKLDDFLPNPSLADSNEILAACQFKELIVEGDIIIEGKVNDENLLEILKNVVYETPEDEKVIIEGAKIFRNLNVQGNVEVDNNFINSVNLDNVMTTDREQTTSIGLFSGRVIFQNVKMTGLFDGINASEIETKSVRTFGDQFIQTELIMKKNFRVSAKKSEIKTAINQIPVKDIFFIDEPIDMSLHAVTIENIGIKDANVVGDIVGSGISNIDYTDLHNNYLRKSIPQEIATPVKVKSLLTRGNFVSKTINDLDFIVFKRYLMGIKNYKEFLLTGGRRIENLFIDGNVNLDFINGRSFNEILDNVIWLNRPNNISRLRFLDGITIDGGKFRIENKINDVSFSNFIDNWVSKDNATTNLKSSKIFNNHVFVEGPMEVEKINGIPFEDLLLKNEFEFQKMRIAGNIQVEELFVERTFNEDAIGNLRDTYSYDFKDNVHIVKSNVLFHHPVKVDQLNTPSVNELNVTQWKEDMIKLDDNNVMIQSFLELKSDLTFEQGFYGTTFNDIDLGFLPKIVLTNDQKMVQIKGDLRFQGDVIANLVGLNQSLYSKLVSRCDPKEWFAAGIPIDRDLIINGDFRIAASSLIDEGLTASFINGKPISSFLTLRTNQSFNSAIKVGDLEVIDQLTVRNLISGTKIENERVNTVMTYGNHTIYGRSVFFFTTVNENLNLYGKVNNISNFDDVIMLDSPVTVIETPVVFDAIETPALITNDLVSGINVNQWYEQLVWKNGKSEQHIDGLWHVDHLRVEGEVQGNGVINERSVVDIEKNLRNKLESIEATIANYSTQYTDMCHHMQSLAKESTKSSHILKYLELDFKITKSSVVHSYLYFGEIFGVNIGCQTFLFKWKKGEENFEEIGSTETGPVDDWKVLQTSLGEIYVIIKINSQSDNLCAYGAGLNIWKFQKNNLVHYKNILQNADNIVELHVNLRYSDRFFTLDKDDVVKSYMINGASKDVWTLSKEYSNYSFVDLRASHDIMLSNSRKLVILESKFKSRKPRTFYIESPLLLLHKKMPSTSITGESDIHQPMSPELPVIFKNRSTPTIQPSTTKSKSKSVKILEDIRSISENFRNGVKKNIQEIHNKTINNLKFPAGKQVIMLRSDNFTKFHENLKSPQLSEPKEVKKDEEYYDESVASSNDEEFEDTTKPDQDLEISTAQEDEEHMSTEDFAVTEPLPIIIDDSLSNSLEHVDETQSRSVEVVEIYGNGIRESENIYFPERGSGEFLMVLVGPHYRPLYVVSRVRDATIKRHQNSIVIYNDIFDVSGSVYQYIPCIDPSHLSVLEFRDETLLAFLEGRREIIVYIYRGIEGFVFFRKISLPGEATEMTSLVLPPKLDYKCDNHYLVVKIEKEVLFYRVKITGNCGVTKVECDSY